MGFHPLDIIVVVGIALLLLGPKTLQSISRQAGKGVGQANDLKKKVLAELPMEDIAKVSDTIAKIPLSPQQAAQQLIASSLMPAEKKADTVPAEKKVEMAKAEDTGTTAQEQN